MERRSVGMKVSAFVIFLLGSSVALAQCPAGSTCFGEIDSNSQAPSISFSGDIVGARWLTSPDAAEAPSMKVAQNSRFARSSITRAP